MRLKDNVNMPDFFQAVRSCRKDVYFVSAENDRLNLKSQLSAYIFLTAARHPKLLENGSVSFDDPQDEEILQDYLI